MADEEKKEGAAADAALGRVDRVFAKVSDYITRQISIFVAFLFFIFTAGAVYGAMLAFRQVPWSEFLIVLPAVLGLFAYYNRTFAIIVFVGVILIFIIL